MVDPGGSIEPDESPADAVVREVWEETGLFVEARADGDEIERVCFWSRSEADALPLSLWLRGVLSRLFDSAFEPWFEPAAWRPPVGGA